MILLDTFIVNLALPAIQTGLHFSEADLGWVQNIYHPFKKQQEVPLLPLAHGQEQLPQVPPAFDAAMRFAGQTQRQHAGDSDAYPSTFEILQGSQGNSSQALWVLLAETANAKAENGLVRSLQRGDRLRDVGTSRGIAKEHQAPQRREHLHAPAKHLAADRF